MSFNDFFADCEADPRSRVLGIVMQALEKDEDSPRVPRIDTDAIVAHLKSPLIALPLRFDMNGGRSTFVELDRI